MGIPEPSGSWACFYLDPSRCVRIKMPLREVHDLVPEPVTMLPSQHRGLQRCDQVEGLEMGIMLGYLGTQCHQKGPFKRQREDQSQRAIRRCHDFDDGGRGHEPWNAGGPWKPEKAGSGFSPTTSGRNQPADTLVVVLTSRTIR